MELGLTFPLQRFLKRKTDYGTQPDRRYCWDAHVIDLRGRKSLLAVHCHSRYTFVCFDVSPLAWRDLPALFETGLRDSLTAAGFAQPVIDDYLSRAGALSLTRTHGRREVAFLNRAWDDVLALDMAVDTATQVQPLLDAASIPVRAAASASMDWARLCLASSSAFWVIESPFTDKKPPLQAVFLLF